MEQELAKLTHELTTLVLAMGSSGPRCSEGYDEDLGDWSEEGCTSLGTHDLIGPHDQDHGVWCLEHGEKVHAEIPYNHRWRLRARSELLLLGKALETAKALAALNPKRNYLRATGGSPMAVCVVVRQGDKYLTVSNPRSGGHPQFPGGGVEIGENVEAAAARELLEETGLVLATSEHLYDCQFGDFHVYFLQGTVADTSSLKEGDAGVVAWTVPEVITKHPVYGPSSKEVLGRVR